jgi:hypothetical protein
MQRAINIYCTVAGGIAGVKATQTYLFGEFRDYPEGFTNIFVLPFLWPAIIPVAIADFYFGVGFVKKFRPDDVSSSKTIQ